MMGCLKSDQGQLFHEFHLNDAVPEDHLVRKIDAALDLSWLRGELAPHYSSMGRPCAELFSLFSSFDGDCQSRSFLIQRNRDKLSTRKFDVGVSHSLDP
jgi:hypothetical protein